MTPALESQIAAIRGFSRFYTRKLGIIEPKLLDSPFTLQEARIMYEIAHRSACTATDLTRDLGLDPGFLSRTLQALQRRQIVARRPSKDDGRINEEAPGLVSVTDGPDLKAGQITSRSVDLTKAGTYIFMCNLPAHYGLGMHTVVTVS